MDLQLKGKRALVTGSSSGIGVGIAKILAAEGVSVVVHGRNKERLKKVADEIAKSGAKVAMAPGDLSDDKQANEIADAALSAFGGIDILVNNAGGGSNDEQKSWFKMPLSAWLETYQMNVMGAGRLIHRLAPAMRERGWGRLIQISTAAGTTPTSAQPDYGPSKAALNNMSIGLSKALANTGVTVNIVSPGMIKTEGVVDFLTKFAKTRGWGDDIAKAEDYVVKGTKQTVNRVGRVEDIGYAVAFIASPLADFINGTNVHVDGGITPSLT